MTSKGDRKDHSNKGRVFLGLRLWEAEHRALGLLAVVNDTSQREVYAQAYKDLVEKRKVWQGEPPSRFPWRASPQPGPGRKRIAVWMLPEDILEISAWAEEDAISAIDAYYTAVYEYLVSADPVQIVKAQTPVEG